MRQTWLVLQKDLLRWRRDPVGLLLWAAIPLAVVLLMKAAFGGSGTPTAQLIWVDQDKTLITQALRTAFEQEQIAELIETTDADSTAAMETLGKGKASVVVIFPRGFADDYLNAKTPKITLIKNPAQNILPKIVEETFSILVDGASYLQYVFDEPLQTLRDLVALDAAPPDSSILSISRGISAPLEQAGAYLLPPVIGVEVLGEDEETSGASAGGESAEASSGKEIGFLELFFPGVLLMSMLFVAQILAIDFWVEDRNGTYARTVSGVDGDAGFVLGKTLAGVVILTAIFLTLLLIGRFALQIHLQNILPAVAYLGACSFGFVAAINYLVVLAKTQKGATVLSSMAVMPLVMLGGSFFPLEAMPAGLRAIGEKTPNGLVGEQLKLILFDRGATPTMVVTLVVALVLGSFFVFLARRQARSRFVGA